MKEIEIFFRNLLLKILLAISGTKKNKNSVSEDDFSKILFIRLNRIGDALVTTPFLHQIKKNLNSKIYLLADRKNHFAFNNNPGIDKVLVFKKGLKGVKEVLDFIKKENIQTIVDLHDDVSTTVSFLISLSQAKNKFALEKENKNIYTQTVPKLDPKITHVVDRVLELSKLFGVEQKDDDIRIIYSTKNETKEKIKLFIKNNFSEKKFLIGINISAGSDARFWGIEKFKLLMYFLANYDVNIILLCAPDDLNLAKQISEKNIIFSSESFDEFAAIIQELNLLFTPDTMAVHLAAVSKVPVFGVYVHYNTDDMIWTPYGTAFDCVITKENTLKNVTFEEVKNKFKPYLEKLLNGVIIK